MSVAETVEKRFQQGRRVLSFAEYLDLFASIPFATRATRAATCATLRALRHDAGRAAVGQVHPLQPLRPAVGEGRPTAEVPRGALIGQEHVQEEIHRALSNFAREGRPNRLVLLHGPNGSAKSTIVGCLMRALEHYSTLDEGALYRFNWVFPSTEDNPRRARLRRSEARVGADDADVRAPRRRSDRREAPRRGSRPSALPLPDRRAPRRCSRKLCDARRGAARARRTTGSCAGSSRTRANRSSRRSSRATRARSPRC